MRIGYDELKAEFKRVLLKRGVSEGKAEACATVFADTTQTGGYSHGVNRFPRFIAQLEAGDIKPEAEPTLVLSLGALEQWDANLSIGNVTAGKMMDQAMALADKYGVGLVALRNANHWMRGGNYGWQAAEKGYVGICWSTSFGVVPPWGGKEGRIGTNPIIMAVPGNPPTMIDMSTTMFSYGMLEVNRLAGKQLPVEGGYDADGNLTRDPGAIEKTNRLLPMGYWKGSGLSIILEMIACLISGGKAIWEITTVLKSETSVSQIFIAVALDKLIGPEERDKKLKAIIDYIKSSPLVDPKQPIRMPCHEFPQYLEENKRLGIPVNDSVWEKIRAL